MERFLTEYPARRVSYVHAVVTVLVAVAAAFEPAAAVVAALLGVAADIWLGRVVHNRVSPAYSDGHPIVNLPPDGRTQEY